jgi:hypothetical protein
MRSSQVDITRLQALDLGGYRLHERQYLLNTEWTEGVTALENTNVQ